MNIEQIEINVLISVKRETQVKNDIINPIQLINSKKANI